MCTIVRAIGVLMALAIAAPVYSQAQAAAASRLGPVPGPVDAGLIFNMPTVLSNIQAYQDGVGFKVGTGTFAYRGLLDFSVNGSADSFSVNGGVTFEYHPFAGPISPYVGAFLSAGYEQGGAELAILPVSVGAVAGVEVFLLDFLSVFAEYQLSADMSYSTTSSSAPATFDYLVHTGLGNSGALGIVIYFMRGGKK